MASENTKRIAKNTLFLYIRLLIVMSVALYTSRIVLNYLGQNDFGIYNVVGGVVTMMAFVRGILTGAIQRFLSMSVGENDNDKTTRIFSAALNIQFFVAVIIILLVETVGVWFLNAKMTIPPDRIIAANWVLQCSLIALVVEIIGIPYLASIISYERMNVFAAISIVEVLAKLGLAYLLVITTSDRLIFYAILTACISITIQFVYIFYCRHRFQNIRYKKIKEKNLHLQILAFSSWTFFGTAAGVGKFQGINILLNIFFGTIINAAVGVANQVNVALSGLVANFQLSLNPQIYKSYAANDLNYFYSLIFRGAKFSFFLMYIFSTVILFETDYILSLWLVSVPPYSVIFCRLILVTALVDCISGPLMTATMAVGKIKYYQITVGSLLLLILPLSYLALRMGHNPESVFWITLGVSVIALFSRLLFLRHLVNLSIRLFIQKVLVRIVLVVVLSLVVFYVVQHSFDSGFMRLVIMTATCLSIGVLLTFIVGLNANEKRGVLQMAGSLIKKLGF